MRKGILIFTLAMGLLLAVPSTAFALQVSADCGSGRAFQTRGTSSNYQHHTHDGVKVSWYFMGTETHSKYWGFETGWEYATLTGTYITGSASCILM